MRRRGKTGAVEYQNPWAVQTTAQGDPVAAQYGEDRWRPLPTLGPEPLQIGVFGATLLTQFPSYYDQPQLHQGVEGLSSDWFTPSVSSTLTFQQTQRPTNIAGGQRFAGKPGAPIGPLSARALAARVSAAQVRQSGLAATQWAQGLTGG
jgi:hypothetical protein